MTERASARRVTPALAAYLEKLERFLPGITRCSHAGNPQETHVATTIPQFMLGDIGRGLENIKDQDFVWYVGIEEDEVTSTLKPDPDWEHGYELRPHVESIMWAILTTKYHPHYAAGKLITTLNALGLSKKGRGRPESIDDAYLREIAIRARRHMFDIGTSVYPSDAIIQEVIDDRVAAGLKMTQSNDSLKRRLRKNFEKNAIKLISSIGTEDILDRGPQLDAARRILDGFDFIGVHTSRAHLGPEWKKPVSDQGT